jgi:hypothetical protein
MSRSSKPLFARLASTVRSFLRQQAHTRLQDEEETVDATNEQIRLFLQGVELAGRLLDAQGDEGLAKAAEDLARKASGEDERILAASALLAMAQTAAEESTPKGLGRILESDEDPKAVLLFGIPVSFFAKDPEQLQDTPWDQLNHMEHAQAWKEISMALRDSGILTEDAFTLMHPTLQDPKFVAKAPLAQVRKYPHTMMQGLLERGPVPILGATSADKPSAVCMCPVQARVLVGALIAQRPESVFFDRDPRDDIDLAMAYDSVVATLEDVFEKVFPDWSVGVLHPRPLYEAAVDAAMSSAEYWLVQAVHRVTDLHEDLQPQDLRAVVALVEEPFGDVLAQVSLVHPQEDLVLEGVSIPLDGLEAMCAAEDLPEMFASVADAVLQPADELDVVNPRESRSVCVAGVLQRAFDAQGRELFSTIAGSRKPVWRPQGAEHDVALH